MNAKQRTALRKEREAWDAMIEQSVITRDPASLTDSEKRIARRLGLKL